MASDYLAENHKSIRCSTKRADTFKEDKLKQNKNYVNAYLKRFSTESPKESDNYVGFSFTK